MLFRSGRLQILTDYIDKIVGLEKSYFKVTKLRSRSIEITIDKDYCLLSVLSAFHRSYIYGNVTWDRMIVSKLLGGGWAIEITIAKEPRLNRLEFHIVT